MVRYRWNVVAAALLAGAACSSPKTHQTGDASYSGLVAEMVASAETVVMAKVVLDGAHGEVADHVHDGSISWA